MLSVNDKWSEMVKGGSFQIYRVRSDKHCSRTCMCPAYIFAEHALTHKTRLESIWSRYAFHSFIYFCSRGHSPLQHHPPLLILTAASQSLRPKTDKRRHLVNHSGSWCRMHWARVCVISRRTWWEECFWAVYIYIYSNGIHFYAKRLTSVYASSQRCFSSTLIGTLSVLKFWAYNLALYHRLESR